MRIREKNSTIFFNNYHKGKKFDQRGKKLTSAEKIRPAGKKIRPHKGKKSDHGYRVGGNKQIVETLLKNY